MFYFLILLLVDRLLPKLGVTNSALKKDCYLLT